MQFRIQGVIVLVISKSASRFAPRARLILILAPLLPQLNFDCIGRIGSDKFRFAVDDKQKKALYEEAVVNQNKDNIDRN